MVYAIVCSEKIKRNVVNLEEGIKLSNKKQGRRSIYNNQDFRKR